MKNIKLRKKIVRIGNSQGIIIDDIIMEGLGLNIGDTIDISEINKVKYKPLPKSKDMIKDIKEKLR